MIQLFSYQSASTTLTAATPTDLLPGSTSGSDLNGANVVFLALANLDESNAVETVELQWSPTGSLFGADSRTYSIAAAGTKRIEIRGFSGFLRVVATSAGGAAVQVDVAGYESETDLPYQLVADGVAQSVLSGGTVVGDFSQSDGTFALEGSDDSTLTTSSGDITVDPTGALALGPANATSVAVGASDVAPSFPGGLTVAANKAVTGAGAMAVEATGALSLGVNASSTSIVVGQATVAPSFTGGVSIAANKAVTGAGAMAVEATGALTVAGAAGTTSSLIGRAGNLTTMVGDTRFAGDLQVNLADAGAAAASGTANAYAGTFTIASGGSTYTLTNNKISATSLLFVTCVSGAVAQSVYSFIPGSNQAVLTLSGNAGADATYAFLVINPGA